MKTPLEVAVAIAARLEEAGFPYAIGGALAYAYWGVARATHDVDLNVFIVPTDTDIEPVLDALEAAGAHLDRSAVRATAEARGDARVRHGDIPVDLFFNSIPLHEEAARRRVQVVLLGRPVQILSAEDLVTLKMLFFRAKDLVDVERVVAIQGDKLDREYVRRWLMDCVGADDPRLDSWRTVCGRYPLTS